MSFQFLDSTIRDLLTFNAKVFERLEKMIDDFRVLNEEFRTDSEKLAEQVSELVPCLGRSFFEHRI